MTSPTAPVDVTAASPLHVVYLGINGVLHPSRSTYELVMGHMPEADGHRLYEAVPMLEHHLSQWKTARIVLTSAQTWARGLSAVKGELGPFLASRVLSDSYTDLTTKVPCGPRQMPIGNADYWRLLKAEIVRLHVEWLRPTAWIAVDDETLFWSPAERALHLVAVDPCKGLLDRTAQDRLATAMAGQFGPADSA